MENIYVWLKAWGVMINNLPRAILPSRYNSPVKGIWVGLYAEFGVTIQGQSCLACCLSRCERSLANSFLQKICYLAFPQGDYRDHAVKAAPRFSAAICRFCWWRRVYSSGSRRTEHRGGRRQREVPEDLLPSRGSIRNKPSTPPWAACSEAAQWKMRVLLASASLGRASSVQQSFAN